MQAKDLTSKEAIKILNEECKRGGVRCVAFPDDRKYNEEQILIVAISICWDGLCSGYEICVGCIGKRGEGRAN
jgi:hypothetical protein